MSNTLYGYMSPFELELAREDAKLELEGSRLIYEYAMLEKEHELMLEEIELKSIVMEGCTSDDLYMMYEDENESNEEKKEGIISKIWNWLKNIFNAIIGKTKKAINVIEVRTKYVIDYSIDKLNNLLEDVKNLINDIRNGSLSKDDALKKENIRKYAHIKDIVDNGDDGATFSSNKYTEKIKDESGGPTLGEQLKSELTNLSNKCNDILGNITEAAKVRTNGLGKKVADFLRAIVNKINGTITNMLNKIKNESNDSDNDSDNNDDSGNGDGNNNNNIDAVAVFNEAIKNVKFSKEQRKELKANKDKFIKYITKQATKGATNITDTAIKYMDKFLNNNKNDSSNENKEEGEPETASVHDIDDVYSSIFESLDIDTIDSTFEESYSESHDNDLNAFINILDELLQ